MLEVTPPSRLSSEKTVSITLSKIAGVLQELPFVEYVNIPEIVDENHDGEPFYRNIDTRDFGVLLRNSTGKKVVVNKVIAFCQGEKDFSDWLEKTISAYDIKNLVLVGGNRDYRKYSGMPVTSANLKATAAEGVMVGNICIPSRANEVDRLVSKTLSGCSFFTTQLLFESDRIKTLIVEYDAACREKSIAPAVFFLSFAPVGRVIDVEFFKWLGAVIPPSVEKTFLESEADLGKKSIRLAEGLWSETRVFCKEKGLKVPLSVNVESIALHNLELAKELISILKI